MAHVSPNSKHLSTPKSEPIKSCQTTYQKDRVDASPRASILLYMTVLELKRHVSRLNSRELKELHAYIVKVRHSTPEWKKTTARKLRAVEAGKFVTAEELEARIVRE